MVSGALKACAVDLSKMCNDLRLLSSGPEPGLVKLTFRQDRMVLLLCPGQSKPVIPEVGKPD